MRGSIQRWFVVSWDFERPGYGVRLPDVLGKSLQNSVALLSLASLFVGPLLLSRAMSSHAFTRNWDRSPIWLLGARVSFGVHLGKVPEDSACHPFRQAAFEEVYGHVLGCELSFMHETFRHEDWRGIFATAAKLLEQPERHEHHACCAPEPGNSAFSVFWLRHGQEEPCCDVIDVELSVIVVTYICWKFVCRC